MLFFKADLKKKKVTLILLFSLGNLSMSINFLSGAF